MSEDLEKKTHCDRCDAKFIEDAYHSGRQGFFQFVVPDETADGDGLIPKDREYTEHVRCLCRACEVDLLNWIDGEFTREGAVQLPRGYETGEVFERFAADLLDMAAEMKGDEHE